RRRHTRSKRDWSSDVCSSDLQSGALPFQATERAGEIAREQAALEQRTRDLARAVDEIARAAQAAGINDTAFQARLEQVREMLQRSEERRVGEEGWVCGWEAAA